MFNAAFEKSLFCRLMGRLWACFLEKARQSLIFRNLLESRVLLWLVNRLPALSGVTIAALFIIPHSWFNNLYSLIVMCLLAGLTLLGVVGGQVKTAALPRMGGYAVVFWLLAVIGGLTSLSLSLSFRFLLFYFTAFLGLTVTLSVLSNRRELVRFIAALLAAVSLSGIYGLLQTMAGLDIVRWHMDLRFNLSMPGRVFSFFDNPNAYAMILVLTLPLYFALFFMAETRLGRRLAFLGALPPIVALIFTLSRAGWMAFGLGMIVFFYFTYRWVIPLLGIAVVAILPVLPVTIRDRFLSTFGGEDSSILYRTKIRDTLQPVLSRRWFTGLGLGSETVMEELTVFYEENTQYSILTWQIPPHTHNQYLQLWAEMGIAGAAAFCGMMIAFVKKCVITLFTSPTKNFIAAAGLAGVTGALIMGFADYIWFYPRVMLLFWIVTGITLAAFKTRGGESS